MNMTVRPLNGFLRSPTATHYATLQTLPCAVFTDMVMTVITSAWDFFDPMTEMLNEEQQWAMGVVAHQIAVMFAQRYGTGVETEEIINALSMYEKLSMDTRRMRVQMFDDELLLALLNAPAGMQMGAPPKLTYAKVMQATIERALSHSRNVERIWVEVRSIEANNYVANARKHNVSVDAKIAKVMRSLGAKSGRRGSRPQDTIFIFDKDKKIPEGLVLARNTRLSRAYRPHKSTPEGKAITEKLKAIPDHITENPARLFELDSVMPLYFTNSSTYYVTSLWIPSASTAFLNIPYINYGPNVMAIYERLAEHDLSKVQAHNLDVSVMISKLLDTHTQGDDPNWRRCPEWQVLEMVDAHNESLKKKRGS